MVPVRTTCEERAHGGEKPSRPMSGGPALKRAIHTARARADITSDVQVAARSGVHYDTLMNWYSGRTVPRPHELRKVARALDVSFGDLMAAYEGEPAAEPDLLTTMRDLVASVGELVAEMRRERVSDDPVSVSSTSDDGGERRPLGGGRHPNGEGYRHEHDEVRERAG